jgi:hypothetical protein
MKSRTLLGILISLMMVSTSITNVYAKQQSTQSDTITTEMWQIGQNYADSINAQSESMASSISPMMYGSEIWTLTNVTVVIPWGTVKGSTVGYVAMNQSLSVTRTWSINVGTSYKGYTVGASISGSFTWNVYGPNANYLLPQTNVIATHTSYFSIGKATLSRYTYRVTEEYTGAFIRTETRYFFTEVASFSYSQIASIMDNNNIWVQHVNLSQSKKFNTVIEYQNTINSTNPSPAYSW